MVHSRTIGFMHKNRGMKISFACMKKEIIHKIDIFMHQNQNFAPGMIFSPQICSLVGELYTTACM